jgi:hypothetical protein
MDTEGLASTEKDANYDLKIFTLTILTCSHFIFNCMRTIDEDCINKLSMCVQLAKDLKGKSGALKDEDYERLMPHFTWVIRDADELQLVNLHC